MVSSRTKRSAHPVHAAAGALMLAVPSSAVALAANQSTDLPPAAASIGSIKLAANHVPYGRRVAVSGLAGPNAARQRVALELAPAGTGAWRVISIGVVAPDGHFRLVAAMRRSGALRVIGAGSTGSAAPPSGVTAGWLTTASPFLATSGAAAGTTPSTSPNPTPGSATAPALIGPSPVRRVSVSAQLRVKRRDYALLGGQVAHVRGRLLPGVRGRRVALQVRSGSRWQTVKRTRTGASGRFDLRFTPQPTAGQPLRVRFAGDRFNDRIARPAGRVTVYQPAVVSWYNDGGNTACGFHAYYGVANVSLPCGTQVSFDNGGRTVTATVDDRGPYVGGRVYDLNQNTAAALGFGGVGSIWAAV